jgi:hypothetical protein
MEHQATTETILGRIIAARYIVLLRQRADSGTCVMSATPSAWPLPTTQDPNRVEVTAPTVREATLELAKTLRIPTAMTPDPADAPPPNSSAPQQSPASN